MSSRVFISATPDLYLSCDLVCKTLNDLGFLPIVLEDELCQDQDLYRAIRECIKTCDTVLYLVGHTYGPEPSDALEKPDGERRSWAQTAFDIAHQESKRLLIFILDEDFPHDAGTEAVELAQLQASHHDEIRFDPTQYAIATSEEELQKQVYLATSSIKLTDSHSNNLVQQSGKAGHDQTQVGGDLITTSDSSQRSQHSITSFISIAASTFALVIALSKGIFNTLLDNIAIFGSVIGGVVAALIAAYLIYVYFSREVYLGLYKSMTAEREKKMRFVYSGQTRLFATICSTGFVIGAVLLFANAVKLNNNKKIEQPPNSPSTTTNPSP